MASEARSDLAIFFLMANFGSLPSFRCFGDLCGLPGLNQRLRRWRQFPRVDLLPQVKMSLTDLMVHPVMNVKWEKVSVQIFNAHINWTYQIKGVQKYNSPLNQPWLSGWRRSSASPSSCSPPSSASTRCWDARVAEPLPAFAPQVILSWEITINQRS